MSVDHVASFRREVTAFEAGVRAGVGRDVSLVSSRPGWSVVDLVLHLGVVHRQVARIVEAGSARPPERLGDASLLRLPDVARVGGGPSGELLDWFRDGADRLEKIFAARDPAEPVWSWAVGASAHPAGTDGDARTVGFWLRLQAIEAAVHRWDVESAAGEPAPVETWLAADAVSHAFEVLAPARRAWGQMAAGRGERLRFTQLDGFRSWIVQVDPEDVLLNQGTGCCLVELAGSVSDLMLHLWQRLPRTALRVRGDEALLDRYLPSPAPWAATECCPPVLREGGPPISRS